MGFKCRKAARAKLAHRDQRSVENRPNLPRLAGTDRRALLTGTALASTLLIAVITAPTPAHAVVDCTGDIGTGPDPIIHLGEADNINCVNTEARTGEAIDFTAIGLSTVGGTRSIVLDTQGALRSDNPGGAAYGIFTDTDGDNSGITVTNRGGITVTADDQTTGIFSETNSSNSRIDITNDGELNVTSTNDDADGIFAETDGDNGDVTVTNRAYIKTIADESADAIDVTTDGEDSHVAVMNTGELFVQGDDGATRGIEVDTFGEESHIIITNEAKITVSGAGSDMAGIYAFGEDDESYIKVTNSGEIDVNSTGGDANGIEAITDDDENRITINNSGNLTVRADDWSDGIDVETLGSRSPIMVTNSGDIRSTATNLGAEAIDAFTDSDDSAITVTNSGDLTVRGGTYADAIYAETEGDRSGIAVTNWGNLDVTALGTYGAGIFAYTDGENSGITIRNYGAINVQAQDGARGIHAYANDSMSPVTVTNHGNITVTSKADNAYGIYAYSDDPMSPVTVTNYGDITVNAPNGYAYGIFADSYEPDSPVTVTNHGNITATAGGVGNYASGIGVENYGDGSPITIHNSGRISAIGKNGAKGYGIWGFTAGENSSITIKNSGSVYSSYIGVWSRSTANNPTTIINTGDISAKDHFAIKVYGAGSAQITNAGTITGFVELTEQDDTFTNQSGGVFEAKRTSLFGGGDDVFRNQSGGTVHALRDGSAAPSFEGLERFENKGLISTVDGATGDHFTISNTVGGKDLDFVASGNSRLAVDASLGGPGSATDTFTIEGNVSGTTKVTINNTNTVGGEFNPDGIKIITVTGATPNANAFSLDAPVDAGFFDYDLFFTPTGSGFWSLKSFPGAGAHLLPQLVTAAQDMWHQGSSTWFDRTADLRVLVNGGGANAAYSQDGAANDGIAPAVWVRGSGGWLDRDGSGSTSSNGRNYKFDLDRQLDTMDFQMGLDLGSRDLLSQGDALVFGLLGGFVHGDLDYDSINRNFDYDGGQVGAYATYMKGGLFVDTLLNVHIMELDANGALGFPNNDLDATTVGLRSDAGYRFGSFSGGAFLEPLATLEVTWADIDGFALGGNSVKFDDDANVRGRLGLRAGTTMEAWEGTMMEPFVTGSLWGNLSGENQATLVSNGSTFRYNDDIEDVWGELSAGLNFFNFSQTTSVFAKVDVTLGDDVTGLGGKAGMRVAW